MNIRERSTAAPEAGYADLPPGVGFEPKDEPLRRDTNLLGRVLGQVGDGVHEGVRLEIHDEFYGIPSLIAAEAMVKVPFRMHGERRGFLGVVGVRAEAHEPGPLASKGGELGGDLDYVRCLSDLLNGTL